MMQMLLSWGLLWWVGRLKSKWACVWAGKAKQEATKPRAKGNEPRHNKKGMSFFVCISSYLVAVVFTHSSCFLTHCSHTKCRYLAAPHSNGPSLPSPRVRRPCPCLNAYAYDLAAYNRPQGRPRPKNHHVHPTSLDCSGTPAGRLSSTTRLTTHASPFPFPATPQPLLPHHTHHGARELDQHRGAGQPHQLHQPFHI